jgi:phage tail sheath protein FI
MAFQISPGINITEIDRTGVVNQIVSQTTAAYVGKYKWGPVNEIVTISSENELVKKFGGPDDNYYLDFFSAANYIGYGSSLQLIRAGMSSGSKVATFGGLGFDGEDIWNQEKYDLLTNYGSSAAVGITGILCAKYIGNYGNSLRISLSDSVEKGITFTALVSGAGSNGIVWNGQSAVIGITGNDATNQKAKIAVGDYLKFGDRRYQYLVSGISSGNAVTITVSGSTTSAENALVGSCAATAVWAYTNYLAYKPSTSNAASVLGYNSDEVAVAVIDEDGLFSGNAGQVLDVYVGSKASNATFKDGTKMFYPTLVNNSDYVRWISHPAAGQLTSVTGSKDWGTALNALGATVDNGGGASAAYKTLKTNVYQSLNGGVDATPSVADIISGYQIFEDSESTESNLLIQGGHGLDVAKYLVDLCEIRKDAIAFVSPPLNLVQDVAGALATEYIINWKNNLLNKDSSYGIMDTGWKYQYDKYADTYRWLPLNPDVAGLCARTDSTTSPWFSPAGYNRGQIRNVVKLAFNPSKPLRDSLYTENINPVITQAGAGTVLFGDKTLLKKPSAFDRINVRRLFIALEKAASTAAKFQLFEFNDEFTRANFVGIMEPFLRDVQASRGISDFKIICDETNNTPDIIDANQFVADIYIKPQRTINYIQLNFVATRTSANFDEIGAAVNVL